jgi:D-arabinose 1-dehydrogenase-like Zn-dependent alcohol dehydrogenase
MAKMRVMVVRERGAPFAAEERDIPAPGPEEMRIRVEACGVCHSDVVTVQGLFPIVQYPRVPGHEVIDVIDAVGEGVHGFARDSEDTLDFSKRNNVASMNEIFPLAKAQEAYDRMLSGKARFRVVLRMDA